MASSAAAPPGAEGSSIIAQMSKLVALPEALDGGIETQRIVSDMVSSGSPAVKALWERLYETRVDVEEAEALAGDDVVALAEAKTALALTQGLAVGFTVRGLMETASTRLAAGGSRQEAIRAVYQVLSQSKNTVVAALASELRDEV
jgi:hypothetical protein